MRKIFLITAIAVSISNLTFAKIWRVNNMVGVTADFTTAQAAHNAAASGDTIHLEPSSVGSYGAVTATKTLVWLSVGNYLPQNPGNQFSSIPGVISTMTFNPGSQGSVVSVASDGAININAASITLIRSYIPQGVNINSQGTNSIILQNYMNSNFAINANNVTVTNNIIGYMSMQASASAVITNNVFTQNISSFPVYNSVFQNNIVKGGTYTFSNSTYSNNMHSGTGLPAGNNNLLNVNMATVFENNVGAVDRDYRLLAGSPAIGSGNGGIDMGAFGGTTPFKLALQPAIPAVTGLTVPASSSSSTIQVTFSAKSNN